jgi:hypothetical protein
MSKASNRYKNRVVFIAPPDSPADTSREAIKKLYDSARSGLHLGGD